MHALNNENTRDKHIINLNGARFYQTFGVRRQQEAGTKTLEKVKHSKVFYFLYLSKMSLQLFSLQLLFLL